MRKTFKTLLLALPLMMAALSASAADGAVGRTLLKCALLFAFIGFSIEYDPSVIARANSLVGHSRSEYVCNQVVNYALYGHKDGKLAHDFLNWGSRVSSPQAGDVVVGNDGAHVGIFVSSTQFIHSSVSHYQVIKVGTDQLHYVFPSGYQVRRG